MCLFMARDELAATLLTGHNGHGPTFDDTKLPTSRDSGMTAGTGARNKENNMAKISVI